MVDKALQELAQVANLEAIDFQEIAARRRDVVRQEEEVLGPAYYLRLERARAEDGRILLRINLRMELELPEADFVVEPIATYSVERDGEQLTDRATINAFANEVGIMVLLPYMRQALADVSARVLGEPLLMPILQRGQLVFDEADLVEEG